MRNFRKFGCWLLVVLVMLIFGGCSGAMHSADRDYDQGQKIEVPAAAAGTGPITSNNIMVNNFYLGSVASENNTNQEPSNTTDVDGAAGLNGGTGTNTAQGAMAVLDHVASKFDGSTGEVGKTEAVPVPEKEVVRPVEMPEESVKFPQKLVPESGIYHGLTNPDRPTWYFSKRMDEYPLEFDVVIPGCKTLNVENNGVRDDQGDGYLVKQSDVSGRGMSVLANKNCPSTVARI